MTNVRRHVLAHLATPHVAHGFGQAFLPTEVAAAAPCREHEVWEALWGLVGEGLIYLDTARQRAPEHWQWRLSAAGQAVATGGPWEPGDPEGYLSRLRREIPDLDPLARRYVEEALRAFNARCYLASSVMLGVASEQVFNRLADAYVRSSEDAGTRLRKLIEDPGKTYFVRFQELRKRLEPVRDGLPDGLGGGCPGSRGT